MPLGLYPPKAGSPETYLDGGIDDEQTTITVLDASVLPEPPNIATIGTREDSETIRYEDISGNDLVGCTRGFEGAAKAWNTGTLIANVPCAQHIKALQAKVGEIDAVAGDLAVLSGEVGDHLTDTAPHEGYVTPKHLTITEQTGDSYTLALADDGTLINMNRATAQTLTIPTNATVAFPIGTQILIWQKGAGQVTIAAADGVTLDTFEDKVVTVGKNAVAGLVKTATNNWLPLGNLEASA